MRTLAIVILSVLLVASLVLMWRFHSIQQDQEVLIRQTRERANALSDKVLELESENSKLRFETGKAEKANQALERKWSDARDQMDSVRQRLEKSEKENLDLRTAQATLNQKQASAKEKTPPPSLAPLETGQASKPEAVSCDEPLARQKEKFEAALAECRSQNPSCDEPLARQKQEFDTALAECRAQVAALSSETEQSRQAREKAEKRAAQVKTTSETMVKELKDQIRNQEVTIESIQEKLKVTLVERVLFPSGQANVLPAGKKILAKMCAALQDIQGQRIRVVGHTDNKMIRKRFQGKYPSNWELSTARAISVTRVLLEECRLAPQNLEAVGRSSLDPVADNATAKGRAKNRRVEIIVTPGF